MLAGMQHILAVTAIWAPVSATTTMPAEERIAVAWAPAEAVVGRRFRILLDVTPALAEVAVDHGPSVELFDQTRPVADRPERRYYFRALRPDPQTTITFSAGSTTRAQVTIPILSPQQNLEIRRRGQLQLPRRWPLGESECAERKQGMTVLTTAEQAALKKRCDEFSRHRPVHEAAEKWAQHDDEYLWSLLPPSETPRWHWVNLKMGCPVHGHEIYRNQGCYPWRVDLDGHPWQVQCPVGEEWYPSNDFAAGDMITGPFPDDGYGCLHDGHKYTFIAVYCQGRAYASTSAIGDLADGYFRTGNPHYAHKLGILLTRVADEFGCLAGQPVHRYLPQAKAASDYYLGDDLSKRLRGPVEPQTPADLASSGHSAYCIGLASEYPIFARAYDLVFDALDADETLIDFVRARGLPVRDPADLKRYIEDNLFRVGAQTVMDGGANSNLPSPQLAMMDIALCLNYRRGRELIEWNYNDGGQIAFFMPNFYFKDGAPDESTGSYNNIHVSNLWPIQERMDRLRALRPEVYAESDFTPLYRDPKFKAILDWPIDSICIDRAIPKLGDSGDRPKNEPPPRIYASGMRDQKQTYEYAFKTLGDPKYAKVLWEGKGYTATDGDKDMEDAVRRAIEQHGSEIERHSQLLDGYGVAFLRSEKAPPSFADTTEPWEPRALWLYYSRTRGHAHDDIMDIGLMAHERDLMAHMGYPFSWASMTEWDANWAVHYCARILSDYDRRHYRGSVIAFKALDGLSVVAADADAFEVHPVGPARYTRRPDELCRRTLALIDLGPKAYYAVDVFRLKGGSDQGWSFHGNPAERFATAGLDPVEPQETGTAAGPDVGHHELDKLNGSVRALGALACLYNVRRARPGGPWQADWTLSDTPDLHLHLHMLSPRDAEVILADGRAPQSPAGKGPYELKWVLARVQGDPPLARQYAGVIHTFRGRSPLDAVEPLSDPGASDFIALRVKAGQRTDWIISEEAPDEPSHPVRHFRQLRLDDTVQFSGQYGLYSEVAGRFASVSLVRGSQLLKDGVGIERAESACFGRIVALDRSRRTVVIHPAPPLPEVLVGQYIHVGDDLRRGAWLVTAARRVDDGDCELTFSLGSTIGEGVASGFADGVIETPTRFPLGSERSHNRYYRFYCSARLTNAAGTAEYAVDNLDREGPVCLQPAEGKLPTADDLRTAIGAGGRFIIYDYGLGDAVTFPCAVQLRAVGERRYVLRFDTDVTLRLPLPADKPNARVFCRTRADEEWIELPARTESGRVALDIKADAFAVGVMEIEIR